MKIENFPKSLSIKVEDAPDGFYTETDVMGTITRNFVNMKLRMEEEATKRALIRLGWAPPSGENNGT